MASQTPRVLKNMTAFLQGRGLAGRVDKVTLPELKIKTDEHRAGGMDMAVEMDMGMEAMMAKLTISDPDAEFLSLVGNAGGNSAQLVIRGAFVRDSDATTVAVVAELTGRIKSVSFGDWEAGSKAGQDYEMSVNYYHLTVDGQDVYEIDVENMVRIMGGVDQLANIRDALGL